MRRCVIPECQGTELIKMELESSLTFEKFFCSNLTCRRIYVVPTTTGKIAQVAPLASLGLFVVSLFTMDWETAVEHASDYLN